MIYNPCLDVDLSRIFLQLISINMLWKKTKAYFAAKHFCKLCIIMLYISDPWPDKWRQISKVLYHLSCIIKHFVSFIRMLKELLIFTHFVVSFLGKADGTVVNCAACAYVNYEITSWQCGVTCDIVSDRKFLGFFTICYYCKISIPNSHWLSLTQQELLLF